MAIRCGNCGGQHSTVAEVRNCYDGDSTGHVELNLDEEQRFAGQQAAPEVGQWSHGVREATPKQKDYAQVLIESREIPEESRQRIARVAKHLVEGHFVGFSQISSLITELQQLPYARKANGGISRSATVTNTSASGRVEADGMFRNPKTGEVYKVQYALHGSGRLYAKRLEMHGDLEDSSGEFIPVRLTDIRQASDPEYKQIEWKVKFKFVRGLIYRINPEWRMTREEAKEFGVLYGTCIRCGAPLTREDSIERGMGYTCATKTDGYWVE
jgi:hypothetical protein